MKYNENEILKEVSDYISAIIQDITVQWGSNIRPH